MGDSPLDAKPRSRIGITGTQGGLAKWFGTGRRGGVFVKPTEPRERA